MTSRRADDLPRQIAQLQRKVDELARRSSRQGHGHVLGYAERTTNQTGISTETDLIGLTATVNVSANRRIRISAKIQATISTSGADAVLRIVRGTTKIQRWQMRAPATTHRDTGTTFVVDTPAAGQHTYKLTLEATSGTVDLVAGSEFPAQLVVEDVGSA